MINACFFDKRTLKVADFALSIELDPAAGAVLKMFRTVGDADKFILRQGALIAARTAGKEILQQLIPGSRQLTGSGKEPLSDGVADFVPTGKAGVAAVFFRGIVDGIVPVYEAVIQSVIRQ